MRTAEEAKAETEQIIAAHQARIANNSNTQPKEDVMEDIVATLEKGLAKAEKPELIEEFMVDGKKFQVKYSKKSGFFAVCDGQTKHFSAKLMEKTAANHKDAAERVMWMIRNNPDWSPKFGDEDNNPKEMDMKGTMDAGDALMAARAASRKAAMDEINALAGIPKEKVYAVTGCDGLDAPVKEGKMATWVTIKGVSCGKYHTTEGAKACFKPVEHIVVEATNSEGEVVTKKVSTKLLQVEVVNKETGHILIRTWFKTMAEAEAYRVEQRGGKIHPANNGNGFQHWAPKKA